MNIIYFVLAVLLVPIVVEDFLNREIIDFFAFAPLVLVLFMSDRAIILILYAFFFVSFLAMWKLGLVAFGDVEGAPLLSLGISAFPLVAVALAFIVAVDLLLHKPSVRADARAARTMKNYIPRRINGETVKGMVEKKYELLESAEGEVEMVYGAPLVGYIALALIVAFLVELI